MKSIESLFNDSLWEIRIPNARIESLQEDYKAVIDAKPRTHVFYDETVLFFLQMTLPDDLSTLHEETSRQVHEFFQSLEIQVEAAFVDALSLAASGPTSQNSMHKSPNGPRPNSAQLADKRIANNSPGPFGGRPGGYNDQGRVDSTLLFSYTYNSSEPGKEVEIRPVNGLWTAIFPFSVPVSFIRTKSTNTMLMLSTHVLLRPADQVVPAAAPVDDQYNLECFSMVNLLEGLSDDPNFASSVVPQHHYRPDTPRARVQPPPMTPVLRRSARRTIAVRSALNVRMRTTRVSPMENPLMMSIEVENNSEHGAKFKMTQLDVDVTNAVVTSLDSAELTKGIPEVDGVQGQTIHSRWNCFLDVTDLAKREGALTGGDAGGNTPLLGAGGGSTPQKQLYAPQPSHPSSLLPSQYTSSGTPTQSYQQQYQLHHRNQSLPSSPQPQHALQKGSSLVRRVSSSSSPPVLSNRHSGGPNTSSEVRGRRSSVVSDGTPTSHHQQQFQQQQRGPQSSAGRKSGLGGWGYGRSNNENHQGGLAPVQEAGSAHQSPVVGHAVTESENGSYEDETTSHMQGPLNSHSGRPAMNGGGLGLDLAAQGLNGVSQSRPDQDAGDGIVVSFAVTDRVVVGKIFNLEIFIVNRSRHIRRYTLVVPNRKRAKGSDPSQGSKVLPPLPSGESAVVQNVPIDPYMEEPELLRRHVDNETTEADIICLENNVRLSPLYPLTCQNLNLRFIAIKEQLHTIDLVQLVDNDTGFVTNLRNCLCFMAEASFGALSQQVPEVGK
ncbi:hypothetical protein BGZ68_006309 [Mortierella alpina]|nr:hypothetical protein BGZ68_006309 [Mortierella alpina]